jgi:hypothetical protein
MAPRHTDLTLRRDDPREIAALTAWNAKRRVGQTVETWLFERGPRGTGRIGWTCTAARLDDMTGIAVVWVEVGNRCECVALQQVRAIGDIERLLLDLPATFELEQ